MLSFVYSSKTMHRPFEKNTSIPAKQKTTQFLFSWSCLVCIQSNNKMEVQKLTRNIPVDRAGVNKKYASTTKTSKIVTIINQIASLHSSLALQTPAEIDEL